MGTSYIICAAGLGTRTKAIDEHIPKALLQIDGVTLLEYACGSLPLQASDQLIVIGQRQDRLLRVQDRIKAKIEFLDLDGVTSGQLQTAVLGLSLVKPENSIAIFNADSWFECKDLLTKMADKTWQGIVPCSIEKGDSWSFCRVENEKHEAQQTIEVTEKQRISQWCSVGFYFFRDLALFKSMANEELSQKSITEFYVSKLYNRYLKAGHKVLMLPTNQFKAMGSIEQFSGYWGLSLGQLKQQNEKSPFRQ